MTTVILWARDVVRSSHVADPSTLLAPPDGRSTSPSGGFVTVKRFEGGFYHDLLTLLDGRVQGKAAGDAVTAADLARADVLAFELNGGSPAPSGGWESCKWVFEDGLGESVSVLWDEREKDRGRWPGEVVANGSTDGDRYSRFFEISPPTTWGPTPAKVVSYILFSLPTLDVSSPGFTITLSGYLTGVNAQGSPTSEGTPDPDAVGVLRGARERGT